MHIEAPQFKQWLAAEKQAQAAERQLHAAMLRFSRNTSAPPLDELAQSARALRTAAHGLFDEAMQELKDIADSLHPLRGSSTGATGLHPTPARHRAGSDSGGPSQPASLGD